MKLVLRYLSIALFVALSSPVTAQNMAAVNRVLANQNMQFQMQMNRSMWGYWGTEGLYSRKFTFTVVLADGTTKEVSSKIYMDTAAHKSYLLSINKSLSKTDSNRNEKLYPQQTKTISRILTRWMSDKAPLNIYTGIAKDSCWMFKFIAGPISAYSLLSEIDELYFNPATIVGIQLNNGEIIKFNEANLTAMVGNDADALEDIKRKNYLKAIRRYNRNAEKAAKKQR